MPRIERRAEVTWRGSSAKGAGQVTAGSGAFRALPYSEPTRIGAPEGETSPEELLAAAHACCFSMSLAAELTRAKAPPERVHVTATVVMDEVAGGGHRVVESQLRGRVRARIDAEALARLAGAADVGCPFSALVRASAQVTVELELDEEA